MNFWQLYRYFVVILYIAGWIYFIFIKQPPLPY